MSDLATPRRLHSLVAATLLMVCTSLLSGCPAERSLEEAVVRVFPFQPLYYDADKDEFGTYRLGFGGFGSGFVVGHDAEYTYVLTNYHVVRAVEGLTPKLRGALQVVGDPGVYIQVEEGNTPGGGLSSTDIEVKGGQLAVDIDRGKVEAQRHAEQMFKMVRDKLELRRAKLVTRDEDQDLAVYRIERTGLPAIPLLREDWVQGKKGSPVYAYGFPGEATVISEFDEISIFSPRITDGSVSGFDSDKKDTPVVAHGASINPGSSGGPLVTEEGALIGVNTRKSPNTQMIDSVSYAVSVTAVRGLLEGNNIPFRTTGGIYYQVINNITVLLFAAIGVVFVLCAALVVLIFFGGRGDAGAVAPGGPVGGPPSYGAPGLGDTYGDPTKEMVSIGSGGHSKPLRTVQATPSTERPRGSRAVLIGVSGEH